MIRLRLHGPALASTAEGRSLPLRGRAAVLVAMAALQPGGVPREHVAGMVWPDAPNPRQNLRQQLLRFRQALGQALLSGESTLALADGVQLLPAEHGAELLAGEPATADDAGQWLQRWREHERQGVIQGLREACTEGQSRGDGEAALRPALEWMRLDPDDESAHLAVMQAHYLRGDAAAGLRAHAALVERAGPPSARSRSLAQALKSMQAGATGNAANLPALAPPSMAQDTPALAVVLRRPPQTIGRAGEYQAVTRAWAEGRAVLLLGEAGMGKSHLMAECLRGQAHAVAGAGRPGDAGAPYSTLSRLIRPLLTPAVVAKDPSLARLNLLLGGSAPAAGPALRPGDLHAAVVRLLDAVAPECVAVDDLHFADPATVDLLSGLIAADPQPAAHPRRWILAQRPAETSAAAQALADSLCELRRLEPVTLSALTPASTGELIGSLGLPGLDQPRLVDALARHCGGNPLFLLETLKQGLADGSLARGELPWPKGVGALIERRLQRLGEPALNLARVAAIAGVDFCIELAESALGQSAVQLSSAWQELQQAQVLRDESFVHDLVADAVLRGVPQVVSRRVHAQCAAWLEARGGEPARLARHWLDAGRHAEAAAAFTLAAQRALATARQAEAADLYGQAAAAHAQAGETSAHFEARAARVSSLIGARADEAALAEARQLGASAASDAQRARAARVLADLLGQRGPFEEALTVGRAGIALARAAGVQDELVRLTALTAGNLCKTGAAQEAYGLLLPLREWVDAQPDDQLRHIWYGYWAATLGHIGRLREGVAAYDLAFAAAQRLQDRAGQSMALLNQCVVLRTMGALERALDGSRRGLALAPPDSDNASQSLARLMHARNEAESGHFAAALQALEALLPQFEAMGSGFWVWATRGTLARLWQHLGQHARALQALKAPQPDALPAWMQASTRWIELEVAHWRAQPLRQESLRQALALLDTDPHRRAGNRVRGLRFAGAADVLSQADGLAETARSHEQFGVLAALHMHQARAASAMGQPDRACIAAQALVDLLHQGYTPEFTYLPEAWLAAADAFEHQDRAAAAAALAAGLAWVQQRALPQVPAPFIDSFLQRNPVNRALLARS